MPRSLSGPSLNALLAQETAEAFLVLLTVTTDTGDEYITSDSVATTHNLNTYNPLPFNITLPNNVDGQVSTSRLSIDNVDRRFIEDVRNRTTPLAINIKVVLSSNTEDIMAEFTDFTLRQISYDVASISGTLTLEDFLQEPVGIIMAGNTFPGLFYN